MSPIKGLTEKRRLPRLGKIHLGIRNEKGYPMKVDYFVVPEHIDGYVGDKPQELRIFIPVENEEEWASQYYRCYSKTRGLVCKGDGEKCMRLVNVQTGEMVWKEDVAGEMREAPCKGRECPDYKVKCKEVMNLLFLLPDVPGLGIWQIDTGSINSILNINSEAAFIKAAYGRITGLPLLLTLEPKEGRTPDGKVVTIYVMHLRTRLILSEMMALAQKPTEQVIIELQAGDGEIPELLLPEEQEPASIPSTTAAQVPAAQETTVKMPKPGAFAITQTARIIEETRARLGLSKKEVMAILGAATVGGYLRTGKSAEDAVRELEEGAIALGGPEESGETRDGKP